MLKRGQDPRKFLENHRERGAKQFTHSYEDIAEAAGVGQGAVRMAVSRGQLDPESISSIVEFVLDRRRDLTEHRGTLKTLVQEARSLTGIKDDK